MKKNPFLILVALAVLLAAISLTHATTSAQSGGGYDLTWNVIANGGATFSTGGTYSLGGTMGQSDAGTMSGGSYSLLGGFWVDFLGNRLYLPLIEK